MSGGNHSIFPDAGFPSYLLADPNDDRRGHPRHSTQQESPLSSTSSSSLGWQTTASTFPRIDTTTAKSDTKIVDLRPMIAKEGRRESGNTAFGNNLLKNEPTILTVYPFPKTVFFRNQLYRHNVDRERTREAKEEGNAKETETTSEKDCYHWDDMRNHQNVPLLLETYLEVFIAPLDAKEGIIVEPESNFVHDDVSTRECSLKPAIRNKMEDEETEKTNILFQSNVHRPSLHSRFDDIDQDLDDVGISNHGDALSMYKNLTGRIYGTIFSSRRPSNDRNNALDDFDKSAVAHIDCTFDRNDENETRKECAAGSCQTDSSGTTEEFLSVEHDGALQQLEYDKAQYQSSSKELNVGETTKQKIRVLLAEFPLFPGRLRRLPGVRYPTAGRASQGIRTSPLAQRQPLPAQTANGRDSLNDQSQYQQWTLPYEQLSKLPPNAVLVEYTDGMTRVEPNFYHLLMENGILSAKSSRGQRGNDEILNNVEQSKRTQGSKEVEVEDKHYIEYLKEQERLAKRFSEEAFESLGRMSIGPKGNSGFAIDVARLGIKKRSENVESHRHYDKFPPALHGSPDKTFEGKPSGTSLGTEDDSDDNLRSGQVNDEARKDVESGTEEYHFGGQDPVDSSVSKQIVASCSSDKALHLRRLREEISRRQDRLQAERDEVARLEAAVRSDLKRSKHIMGCTRKLRSDADAVEAQIIREASKLSQSQFILEARRMKLFRNLRRIYPIQSLGNNRFAISGLELPQDMYDTSIPASSDDQQLSSALGFVCHLVSMCSKYLSIPLRYGLVCNSSRSAIISTTTQSPDPSSSSLAVTDWIVTFDGIAAYPLFKEKVDREHFDRAVLLLERNIECLLKKQEISFLSNSHMLYKLDLLFEQLI